MAPAENTKSLDSRAKTGHARSGGHALEFCGRKKVYVSTTRLLRLHDAEQFAAGVTGHLETRVWQHKNGEFEGFSADYKTHRLVWFERHAFIAGAIAREKQIKRWRRAKKEWLVSLMNPQWKDLSEGWFEHHRYEPPEKIEKTQGPSTPTAKTGPRSLGMTHR